MVASNFWCAVLKKRKVEDHDDFILGPMSPKEYKDTVIELNGSRTNRVFEFFKVTTPERLGFAKHHEAAERKVTVLPAAEADTAETATFPRTGGMLSKKATKRATPATAATATAEGKSRKKWGARPTNSPLSAKKMRFVDLDTGAVGAVIATMPLRVAAPSAGGGGETGSPLLVLLSPKEKDSDDESDVRVVSSVGDAPRDRSLPTLGHEGPCDEGKSSSASSGSSSSSTENTDQSASPSATGAEKDDFVAEAEEEEEPESSKYHVMPEEPQAAAARLQIPPKVKLIVEKQIRFLGLMSGGHERRFLEEARSSFAIPHEEEYFSGFSSEDRSKTEAGCSSRRRMVQKHRRPPSNRFAPMWRG
jgi:hypothetical protein